MRWLKVGAVVAVLTLGWLMDGSWKGAVAWAMILAFGWAIWWVVKREDQEHDEAWEDHRRRQARAIREEFERDDSATPK